MPRGRPPQGDHPLSDAERQARCQARRQAQQATPIIRYRPPTDRGTRPQRWREAVAELLTLQEAAPGATHCRMPCAIARRRRLWRPSATSISSRSPRSNHHAAIDAIERLTTPD